MSLEQLKEKIIKMINEINDRDILEIVYYVLMKRFIK